MSKRKKDDYQPLGLTPGAVIDTDVEAMNLNELTETNWRIVAYRRVSPQQFGMVLDRWDYTFPEIAAWRTAIKNGRVLCVHVKRPSGIVLVAKLARKEKM